MDYVHGLRVNCMVRGGEARTRESWTRVRPRVRVEQRVQVGGRVGRRGQQDQDWSEESGPRGHRAEGAVTLTEVPGVGGGIFLSSLWDPLTLG